MFKLSWLWGGNLPREMILFENTFRPNTCCYSCIIMTFLMPTHWIDKTIDLFSLDGCQKDNVTLLDVWT